MFKSLSCYISLVLILFQMGLILDLNVIKLDATSANFQIWKLSEGPKLTKSVLQLTYEARHKIHNMVMFEKLFLTS